MCGRFVVARATSELAVELDVDRVTDDEIAISYNVAPTARIPIVVEATAPAEEADEYGTAPIRRLEAAKWGLVPGWAKDVSVGVRAFNARSETAAEKPTFRAAVKKRRAVIPVDGYYEWRKGPDGAKQPYFIHPQDGSLLLFAGLYEWWKSPADEWLLSATILTRGSTPGQMTELHDRMPVFLARADVDEWLDAGTDGSKEFVLDFAERGGALAETLELDAVDRRVGNVRENDPDLIRPC